MMDITPGLMTFAAGMAGIGLFLAWGIKMMLAGELSLEPGGNPPQNLPGYGQMPMASTTGNFMGDETGGSNATWDYDAGNIRATEDSFDQDPTRTMGIETMGIKTGQTVPVAGQTAPVSDQSVRNKK